MRREYCFVLRIPLNRKVETAFLNPTFEIFRSNSIRCLQEATIGMRKRYWRLLHRYTIPIPSRIAEWIGAEIDWSIPTPATGSRRSWRSAASRCRLVRIGSSTNVVLDYVSTAIPHVLHQPGMVGAQVRSDFIRTHACDNR